jgi:hypothetical protein
MHVKGRNRCVTYDQNVPTRNMLLQEVRLLKQALADQDRVAAIA